MKKLPIYKLVMDDSQDKCVDFVALVDEPAIERYYMAFEKQKPIGFAVANADQRIVSGPIMIPDMPIYRRGDAEIPQEHYIMFDSGTIKKIVLKFFKQKFTSNVNLQHNDSYIPSDIYMFESFLTDSTRGIAAPKDYGDLPDGTWFGSYKVDNEVIWSDFIKNGILKGFSVEGYFKYDKTPIGMEEKMLSEIENILKD